MSDLVTVNLSGGRTELPQDLVADLTRDGALRCGPYELLAHIANGGHALVFRARRDDGEEHALRVVPWKVDVPRSGERWLASLRKLQELEHPYLARYHASGIDQGWAWCSQDLGAGPDLETALRERTLSREAGLEVLALAARAIGHAHAQGVFHPGELRPGRILVAEGQPPLVIGFGLQAHPLAPRGGCCDDGGAVLALPYHVAPELLLARPRGAPADVFSLGVVLFRVLTGRRPFDGESIMQLARTITLQPPPRPRSIDETIPPALEEVCLHALEKDPEHRPPDAAKFADELVAAMVDGKAPAWTPATRGGPLGRLAAWVAGR